MQVLPPGSSTQSQPVKDPWLQVRSALQSFDQTAKIKFGTITDVTAIANCDRVQLEKGTATMLGVLATGAAAEIMGARSIGTIPPGTVVLCVEHPQSGFVVILGTLPRPVTDSRLNLQDFVSQTSRMYCDEAHRLPIMMPGGVVNWSAGRPLDATMVGEQGWQTETGTRIFIDPFMVQMGVDEVCGLTAFYADQLLRIDGYNLEMLAAGYNREAFDDQGECSDFQGWTPYPHEQSGLFQRGDNFRALDAQTWQIDQPHYSAVEPKNDRAAPFHRVRHYQGYLGQGGVRQVVLPPKDGETNSYDGFAADAPAVFNEWIGLDGRYAVGSARGISIVKRLPLLAPGRRRPANDPAGDNETNYKAAGLTGAGPAHQIKSSLQTTTESPGQERAAGVGQLHAYLFNYASVHPFLAHANDFVTPDTSELPHAAAWTPNYTELKSRHSLEQPPTQSLTVDHRYGETEFFAGEASIDITEDGSIVLKSAYGSSLVLGPHGVEIHSPGDVTVKSGKSIVNWAGQDIVQRAKSSIDLTTTVNDIRIKAEKDVQVIAGNGGTGGVLVESRSSGDTYNFDEPGEKSVSSGIVLRAPYSKLMSVSAGAYIRTGGPRINSGPIVLDAARGGQNVITHSQSIEHHLKNRMALWWSSGSPEQTTIKTAMEITPNRLLVPGAIQAKGGGTFGGQLLVRGNILVAEGHIATEKAKQSSNLVPTLEGGGLAAVANAVTAVNTAATKTLVKSGQTAYNESLKTEFYEDGKPGSSSLLQKMQGSLRVDDNYHRGGLPSDYIVHAAPWQKNGTPWNERPVQFGDTVTYPHPGKKALTEQPVFYPEPESGLKQSNGQDAPHGSMSELGQPYQDARYAQVTPKILDGNYTTIADV